MCFLCSCASVLKQVELWCETLLQHRSAIVPNKNSRFWPKVRPLEYNYNKWQDSCILKILIWKKHDVSCRKHAIGKCFSFVDWEGQDEPEKGKGTGKPWALTRPICPAGGNSTCDRGPATWDWGAASGLLSDPHAHSPEPGVVQEQPLLVSLFLMIKEGPGSSQINGITSAAGTLSITVPPHLTKRQEWCSSGRSRN